MLTIFVTSFTVHIKTNLHNGTSLDDMLRFGLLVQVESLLTAYGDELGMMEDLVIAVKDMQRVTFQVCIAGSSQNRFSGSL